MERDTLRAVLLPQVQAGVLNGVRASEAQLQALAIDFNATIVHDAAAIYAGQYTDALLSLLSNLTEVGVGDIIEEWISTPGATEGDLVASLTNFLDGNTVRASLIGVTESTRAFAQGNILAYSAAGAIPPPIWTGGDNLTGRFGPPGHPNCRCDLGFVYRHGLWLIQWLTNNDDLVCDNPLETPWGEVDGCQALHGICISECEYMGEPI